MTTRLRFDLKSVIDQARHAILADRNYRTPSGADNTVASPALWFYRYAGRVQLCSNGTRSGFEVIAAGHALTVYAQPEDALTTPAVRPPDVDNPAALALLNPDGQSLFDELCQGLAAGRQYAMLDPQTLSLGVGRRRIRGTATRPEPHLSARSGASRPVPHHGGTGRQRLLIAL